MTSLTKAQLCAIIVERNPFYGSRTMKKINKWWTKNHNEITGHNKHGARVIVGKAVHELNRFKQGRIAKLMRLSKEDLERTVKLMSARELERRYQGPSRIKEKDLPPIELQQQRRIIVSKEDLREWNKQSRKHARRKAQPIRTIEKPKVVKRKRLTTRTAQKGTLNWIKSITQFNKTMESVSNVAGIEG